MGREPLHLTTLARNNEALVNLLTLSRLGQKHIVKVYDYCVLDSFNMKQSMINLGKAAPGIIAELNKAIFNVGLDDSTPVDSENTAAEDDSINNTGDKDRVTDSRKIENQKAKQVHCEWESTGL